VNAAIARELFDYPVAREQQLEGESVLVRIAGFGLQGLAVRGRRTLRFRFGIPPAGKAVIRLPHRSTRCGQRRRSTRRREKAISSIGVFYKQTWDFAQMIRGIEWSRVLASPVDFLPGQTQPQRNGPAHEIPNGFTKCHVRVVESVTPDIYGLT
jgi:hypothetical protein